MKRILCVLLILSMLYIPVYASSATVTVDIPERGVLVGDQYYVTVSVSDSPGFASLQIELSYNKDVVSCVRVVPGDVVSGMLSDTNPDAAAPGAASAILSAAGTSNTAKNGTVATFIFEKPKAGDPEFSFSLIEMRQGNGSSVPCTVSINNQYGSTAELPGDETTGGDTPTPPPSGGTTIPILPPTVWPDPILPPVPEIPVTPDVPLTPETPSTPSLPPAFQDSMMQLPLSFTDVTSAHWAKSYIDEATARGVISGYPDRTFHPDREMTRAEFTTLLWKLSGSPSAVPAVPAADVERGDWFCEAVAWAYAGGYVNGVTKTEFRPGGTVTREQAMTILYRYAGSPLAPGALSGYADGGDVSPYARAAMSWATENGIITGVGGGRLAPAESATRAQLCTMIVRYIHYVQSRTP